MFLKALESVKFNFKQKITRSNKGFIQKSVRKNYA
jgi:hypothetical protein